MADDAERARRLEFAIPPIEEPPEEIEPEWLDAGDPDDRALLIRAAHPELDLESDTVFIDGREFNPRFHLAIHEVVATQLADGEPPEVWATARRLRRLGYGRHEILHMLGAAMSGELWEALQGRRGYDAEAHRAALAALPESWERQRPGGPAPPAARGSHDAELKRRRTAQRAARRRNRRR
jgi:Domain of unknown function (DUF1841)